MKTLLNGLLAISLALSSLAFAKEQNLFINKDKASSNIKSATNNSNQIAIKKLLSVFAQYHGTELSQALAPLLSTNLQSLIWNGKEAEQYTTKDAFLNSYLLPTLKKYTSYQKIVGRHLLANNTLIIFYQTKTTTKDNQSTAWAGCDIYQFRNGKIINLRIQPDTITRAQATNDVAIEKEYEAISTHYSPKTTAQNRIGMMKLIDLKRATISSKERLQKIIAMMAPNVVQTTWEPQGILYLDSIAKIKKLFQADLLQLYPDFYEGIENYIISGNALIMLQNPSGTMTNGTGKKSFNAWYNCDIYFFGGKTGKEITYLLFQRDTLMDDRQLKKNT